MVLWMSIQEWMCRGVSMATLAPPKYLAYSKPPPDTLLMRVSWGNVALSWTIVSILPTAHPSFTPSLPVSRLSPPFLSFSRHQPSELLLVMLTWRQMTWLPISTSESTSLCPIWRRIGKTYAHCTSRAAWDGHRGYSSYFSRWHLMSLVVLSLHSSRSCSIY